jgi:hypothetical protein
MFPVPEEIQAGGRQVELGVCRDACAAVHQLGDPPLEHCRRPPRSSSATKRACCGPWFAEQVERLAAASGDGRLAVLVLAYCGLRWSELAALRVGRVDLTRRRLTIAEAMTEVDGARIVWGTPKTHEARSVPIPQSLVDDLARHTAGKAAGELVFTTAAGAPLRNRNARRGWFDAAAIEVGVPGLTPHELRHTAASLAVSAGANVKAVQRMLGHASAVMTLDRYADLFDDDLDAVAARLDDVRSAVVYPMCTGGTRSCFWVPALRPQASESGACKGGRYWD